MNLVLLKRWPVLSKMTWTIKGGQFYSLKGILQKYFGILFIPLLKQSIQETLVNILELNDIFVDQVVAYETVPNQQLENLLGEEDLPDWMVFFSPSGASYSLPILDRFHQENLSQVRLVAIGPTTQKEIEKLGYQVYRTAGKPTPGAVRQALVEE